MLGPFGGGAAAPPGPAGKGQAGPPRGPHTEALQQGQGQTDKKMRPTRPATRPTPFRGSGAKAWGWGLILWPRAAPLSPLARGRAGKGEQTPMLGRGAGSAVAAAATSQPRQRLPLPLAVSPRLYGDRIRPLALPLLSLWLPRPFSAPPARHRMTWRAPRQPPATSGMSLHSTDANPNGP